MTLPKTLCGGFQFQHVLPVRSHPDEHRESERDGNKAQQGEIQQAHLVQVIEIGHWPDGQDIVAARNTLNEGIFLVQCDDVSVAQTLHRRRR